MFDANYEDRIIDRIGSYFRQSTGSEYVKTSSFLICVLHRLRMTANTIPRKLVS